MAVALLALIAVLLVLESNQSACQRLARAECWRSKDGQCYAIALAECGRRR